MLQTFEQTDENSGPSNLIVPSMREIKKKKDQTYTWTPASCYPLKKCCHSFETSPVLSVKLCQK